MVNRKTHSKIIFNHTRKNVGLCQTRLNFSKHRYLLLNFLSLWNPFSPSPIRLFTRTDAWTRHRLFRYPDLFYRKFHLKLVNLLTRPIWLQIMFEYRTELIRSIREPEYGPPCLFCGHIYNKGDRRPLNLKCGHRYCLSCVRNSLVVFGYLVCPSCWSYVRLDEQGINIQALFLPYADRFRWRRLYFCR